MAKEEEEKARVNAVRFESILNIIPSLGYSACETERIGFDRLGRFAEDVIMFFRDTRLCVSARAAREPSTSPWVKSEVTGSVLKGRSSAVILLQIFQSEVLRTKVQR